MWALELHGGVPSSVTSTASIALGGHSVQWSWGFTWVLILTFMFYSLSSGLTVEL